MKFLRTFTCNKDHEIEMARALIPNAPVFGCCVLHGTNEDPKRIDLYRSNRPHETSEQPFCVYDRNEEGVLITDYDGTAVVVAPTKKKSKATTAAEAGALLEMQNMTQEATP